jgi:hypothetical protein
MRSRIALYTLSCLLLATAGMSGALGADPDLFISGSDCWESDRPIQDLHREGAVSDEQYALYGLASDGYADVDRRLQALSDLQYDYTAPAALQRWATFYRFSLLAQKTRSRELLEETAAWLRAHPDDPRVFEVRGLVVLHLVWTPLDALPYQFEEQRYQAAVELLDVMLEEVNRADLLALKVYLLYGETLSNLGSRVVSAITEDLRIQYEAKGRDAAFWHEAFQTIGLVKVDLTARARDAYLEGEAVARHFLDMRRAEPLRMWQVRKGLEYEHLFQVSAHAQQARIDAQIQSMDNQEEAWRSWKEEILPREEEIRRNTPPAARAYMEALMDRGYPSTAEELEATRLEIIALMDDAGSSGE